MSEAYRKRRYIKHFISKLTDAVGSPIAIGTETNTWFDFALACKYISKEQHLDISNQGIEGELINI